MRRLFVVVLLCTLFNTSFAQTEDIKLLQAEQAVKNSKRAVDSIKVLLVQTRERYIAESENRQEIVKQLTALELEALTLKRKYDKDVAMLADIEQKKLLASIVRRPKTVAQQDAVEEGVVDKSGPERANLVYNRVFELSMSTSDLRSLKQAQRQEGEVVKKIKEYLQLYDKMVAVQLEYERVDSEQAADNLLYALDSLRGKARVVEDAASDMWHSLYDNKLYAYNLLLEKEGKIDVVTTAESLLSNAQNMSEKNASEFESEVLVEYFYRKAAMLDYEINVASALSVNKAKDSLMLVKKALNQDSYCLPKVNIVRRSFIEYEPIKIVKPTLYTPQNPIPQTRIYDFGTIYRIRIGIFTNRPNLSALKGITPLSYTDKYNAGKYAYFVGGFATEQEANDGVAYLKKLGFRSPLVVMWVDGEYIPNIEEWKSKNEGFKIEITGVSSLSAEVKTHISLRNEKAIFSRVGNAFVVGPFISQADAERVVSEIVAMDGNIKAEVKSVK